jgi:prepilin-type N-terminal cleavage/methylation domain-containing protein/prepilin-type processing-associated H-X9-DG protein
MAQSSRRGFTIVELLVAMAIIGILVALAVPAIQAARESARRAQCQNHLRQWGVALHLHEGTYECFPAGYRIVSPTGTCFGQLLPYVEQANLRYDRSKNWDDPANRLAVQTPLPFLLCPSAPSGRRVDAAFPDILPAAGDYTPTHGVNAKYCRLVGWPLYDPPDENGMLIFQPLRAADVRDGLSQTIALVEDAGRPELWRVGRRRAAGVASDAGWADPNYEIALDGSDYLTTGPGQELGPCVMNCTNHNEAYSFHPGGCNLLFGDGAVRLVSDQIEPKTFAALTTRASKDVAGSY